MGNIELPVMIPNKLLISPGIWNDNEYSAKEIEEGFMKTNWNDKAKISLWLNHDDRNTAAFVGYVRNPTLASEGRIFGDLELWDEKTAVLLTEAMAKFGISAKLKGEEDKKGKMKNFTFENFSIVTTPACSEAYINLSQKEEEIKITSKYLKNENLEILKKEEFTTQRNERGSEEMEKLEKETNKIEAGESKELSEKEMLKALSEKFDKLLELLSKKELQEEVEGEIEEESSEPESKPESKPEEELSKKEVSESKELELVKKELAEIKEKLNAPKSKTVRNLSSNTITGNEQYNENVFCDFLKEVDKPMKFI